jgi:hypothetical protein
MGAMLITETVAFAELHVVITQMYLLFTVPVVKAKNLMHVPRNKNCNNFRTIYFKKETRQRTHVFASLV